jgi:hypothetical protein
MWQRAWEAVLGVLIATALAAIVVMVAAALWLRPGG